jgi:DNA polymerase elongation subunit (family B)
MEPQSAFYKGPLVVLDFQSLYPSVMIAYNYCYSFVSLFASSSPFPNSSLLTSIGPASDASAPSKAPTSLARRRSRLRLVFSIS